METRVNIRIRCLLVSGIGYARFMLVGLNKGRLQNPESELNGWRLHNKHQRRVDLYRMDQDVDLIVGYW